MAELLRPLCDAAEERVTERLGAAPGTEDVELRVAVTTPHPSSTTLPVLVPPWSVTARRRAFTVTSTPLKLLDAPPTLSAKVRKLSICWYFAGLMSRNVTG